MPFATASEQSSRLGADYRWQSSTRGEWRLIWFILLAGAAVIAWFLLAPRRFSTLSENIPEYVDENLEAHTIVETTEDPREVLPIVQEAQKRAAAVPPPDYGNSRKRSTPRRQS